MVWGEGDDQLWGSGWWTLLGAIAGCHCSVLWFGGAFFLYIDNAKIGFYHLGSLLVYFKYKDRTTSWIVTPKRESDKKVLMIWC